MEERRKKKERKKRVSFPASTASSDRPTEFRRRRATDDANQRRVEVKVLVLSDEREVEGTRLPAAASQQICCCLSLADTTIACTIRLTVVRS